MTDTDALRLQDWVQRLQHHPLPTIDLKLDRMFSFLENIGNPHLQIPPVIHVAGTNGKGSALAFLHAIFQDAGLAAHRYTSPHLIRFNERFVVANKEVETAPLLEALEWLSPSIDACPLTYFESSTALAFLLFSQTQADVTLLEVGMGGRLDATNVHPQPAATVITPIALDHQEFLGDNIADIAGEKAAIMKPGVPSIVQRQDGEAMERIKQVADSIGAPLYCEGEHWEYKCLEDASFYYMSDTMQLTLPAPSLRGDHQYGNAATAVACLDVLRSQWSIKEGNIRNGIAHAQWSGRLQKLPEEKTRKALSTHHEIFVDGAHNPAAAHQLALWIACCDKPVDLILAMHRDKAADDVLRLLVPNVRSIAVVGLADDAQMMYVDELSAVAKRYSPYVDQYDSWQHAMHALTVTKNEKSVILIAGSLYLVGDVLSVINDSSISEGGV